MFRQLLATCVLLLGSTSLGFAQTAVYENDEARYFRCLDISGSPDEVAAIVSLADNIRAIHNEMYEPDIPPIDPNVCYQVIMKEGTFLAGGRSFEFFTSEEHARCTAEKSCGPEFENYMLSIVMTSKGVNAAANIGSIEEMLRICIEESGSFRLGGCLE